MQAEAGQALETIVARKERERVACNGLFMWGVGNAPATSINALARLGTSVPVIFSIMKSKPKVADLVPARIVAWRSYVDQFGVLRDMPDGVLVTSRGDSASGEKTRHYALICRSEVPLSIRRGTAFDPNAYRNVGGASGPVGASQVTALLRQVAEPGELSDYEANIVASLTDGYWVRLVDPVALAADQGRLISEFVGDSSDWNEFVRDLHRLPNGVRREFRTGTLL